MARCVHAAGRGSRRSPPGARYPRRVTTACLRNRTTPSSARSTRTGPLNPPPAISSFWEARLGRSGVLLRGRFAWWMPTARRHRFRSGSARRRHAPRSSLARSRICAAVSKPCSPRAVPTRRSHGWSSAPASTTTLPRWWCVTWQRGAQLSACCRPSSTSFWSGSSTTAAACSSWCTHPLVDA